MTLNPAHRIITALGVEAVALACRVHRSRPYRWMAPRSAGGTGGTIPLKHIAALMALSRARGVPLAAADFLPLPAEAAAESNADPEGAPC